MKQTKFVRILKIWIFQRNYRHVNILTYIYVISFHELVGVASRLIITALGKYFENIKQTARLYCDSWPLRSCCWRKSGKELHTGINTKHWAPNISWDFWLIWYSGRTPTCLLMAWRGVLRVTVTNLGVDTPDRPDFVASVRRRVPERVHAPSSSHLTPCLLILSKHLNTSQDFRMIPILGWCTTLILGDDSENSAVCFPNSW